MQLKILSYPDPRLKKVGRYVDDPTSDEIQNIVKAMFEKLYSTKDCAGLAATQLSFQDPYAITVIDVSSRRDEPLCLINPEIIESSGETFEEEGCMSVFPSHVHKAVKRAEKVKVKALNENGEEIIFEADGFLAKCIQHECDHLQGNLYVDLLPPVKRKLFEKQAKKLIRKLRE